MQQQQFNCVPCSTAGKSVPASPQTFAWCPMCLSCSTNFTIVPKQQLSVQPQYLEQSPASSPKCNICLENPSTPGYETCKECHLAYKAHLARCRSDEKSQSFSHKKTTQPSRFSSTTRKMCKHCNIVRPDEGYSLCEACYQKTRQ